jgi:hypothetical protein
MEYVQGYYRVQKSQDSLARGSGLSDDAYVGVGYMTTALLSLFLVMCALAILPFFLFRRRINGPMVLGGSNSLVISAACHVAPMSPPLLSSTRDPDRVDDQAPLLKDPKQSIIAVRERGHRGDPDGDMVEMQDFLDPSARQTEMEPDVGEENKFEDERQVLTRISQGLVRWGVVKMPVSFYQQHASHDEPVGHLGFGALAHDVRDPTNGSYYA